MTRASLHVAPPWGLPERFGDLTVVRKLGAGGMAETYLCEGPTDAEGVARRVCVKRLHPYLVGMGDVTERFLREGRIAMQLDSEHIVRVIEANPGTPGSGPYLVMDFVEGSDLRHVLARGQRLPAHLTVHVGSGVAAALAHAAAHSVLHRDVSPDNILIDLDGQVTLSDFGVARLMDETRWTRTGRVWGKAEYVAPEYAMSGVGDERCDLYSLGVVLYRCLTGQLPFQEGTDLDTLRAVRSGTHERVLARAPETPAGLAEVVERLLAEPTSRFQRATSVVEELRPWLPPGAGSELADRVRALGSPPSRPPTPEATPVTTALLGASRFEPVRPLGAGGMGAVWLAVDTLHGGEVALKRCHVDASPAEERRLKAEFRDARSVRHPNLVALYELGRDERGAFFTMAVVDGEPVDRWCRPGGRVDFERLRAALAQLVQALGALHDAGVVHRDVKPTNCLVDLHGHLTLLDYGVLARISDGRRPGRGGGTLGFMSPAQLRGEAGSPEDDLYALGALLFELVADRAVFEGPPATVIWHHAFEPPPRLAGLVPDTPPALDELCAALLRKESHARPGLAACADILLGVGSRPTGLPTPAERSATLLGRAEACERLSRLTHEGIRGQSALLKIVGPSGSGKSSLLRWLLPRVGDATVLSSRACIEERIPFNALDAAIDDLAATLLVGPELPLPMREAAGVAAGAFSSLAEVAQATPASRGATFDALAALVAGVAEREGLLWVVDDSQWADTDSVDALAHLVASVPRRLCLILVVRDDVPPGLCSAWLERQRGVETIALGPLDDDTIGRIITQQAGGAERSHEALSALVAQCDGRPLLAELIGRVVARTSASDLGTLTGVVRGLDAPAVRLLAAIAVSSGPTSLSALSDTLDVDYAAVREGVARLSTLGLVTVHEDARGRRHVEIFHARVRETVLDALGPERVREAHLEISDFLEARDPRRLPERVHHLQGAGRVAAAIPLAVEAAEQSSARLAFSNAADLFALALSHTVVESERRALQRRLAESLDRCGRVAEAAPVWRALREHSSGQLLAEAWLNEVHDHFAAGDVRTARELLGEATRAGILTTPWELRVPWPVAAVRALMGTIRGGNVARVGPDVLERANLATRIALLATYVDTPDIVGPTLRAYALYAAADSQAEAAWCEFVFSHYFEFASARRGPHRVAQALRARATERLALVRERVPYTEAAGHFSAGTAAWRQGAWQVAARAYGDSAARLEEVGLRGSVLQLLALAFRTQSFYFAQAPDEHALALRRTHLIAREAGPGMMGYQLHLGAAGGALLRGDLAGARQALMACRATAIRTDSAQHQAQTALHMAAIAVYDRDAVRAWSELRTWLPQRAVQRQFSVCTAGMHLSTVALLRANAFRQQGELDDERGFDRLVLRAEAAPPMAPGRALRAQAYVLEARGRAAESVVLLERSEALARQVGRVIDAAIARYQRGRVLGAERGRGLREQAENEIMARGSGSALLEEAWHDRRGEPGTTG